MFHLTVALLWGLIYVALVAYKPIAPVERAAYVETGAWGALVLLGYNLVRAAFGYLLRRRRMSRVEAPDTPLPPKPVVHPEFHFDDDTGPSNDPLRK